MRIRIRLLIVGAASILLGPSLSAQDSLSVVVLSPRVGVVVDAQEREYFRLFTQVEKFEWAVVLKGQQPLYLVYAVRSGVNGDPSDTVLEYTGDQIGRVSEKIDRFEEIENGTYRAGERMGNVRLLDSVRLPHDGSLPIRIREIVASPPAVSGYRPPFLVPMRGDDATRWGLKFRSGMTVVNFRPLAVLAETLWVDVQGTFVGYGLDSIQEIRKTRPSSFWSGAVYGALAGGVIGGAIGGAAYHKPDPSAFIDFDFGPGPAIVGGAMLGAGIGGLVGGIISSTAGDQSLDVSGRTTEERERAVRQFIAAK